MSKLVEEWRPVVGYEDLYEVSDWGRVRNKSGHIKSQQTHYKGYKVVGLCKYGKPKTCKVHRLVAEAFLPNPENKPVVGHTKTMENGLEDKTANEAWNIAWMTQKENANYGTLPERRSEASSGDKNPMYGVHITGENHPMYGKHLSEETKKKISAGLSGKRSGEKNPFFGEKHSEETLKKMRKEVYQYTVDGKLIKKYPGAIVAAKENGYSVGNISSCCNGKIKTYKGYIWKYSS